MLNQDAKDASSPIPITLTSIRDVKLYFGLDPANSIRAKLQGIVTRVDPRGRIIFFKLYDGTDTIQLIANRGNVSEMDWQSIRLIKQSFRISVDDYVGLSSTGAISVFLRTAPLRSPDLQFDFLPEGKNETHTIGSQIFLARLRARASKYFFEHDFVELEPNFVSASWKSTGMEALKVDYPGFGGPAYLVPSPSPQLLRALVVTGKQRVFSISRCFTTSYRDAASSYQSLILCAKEIGGSLDRMVDLSVSAVRTTLGDVSTRPSEASFLSVEWPMEELFWPPTPHNSKVVIPQIQLFKDVNADDSLKNKNLQLFRICWPPDFVIADGATELLGDGIAIGSMTLHIERMVFLIQSDSAIRRLWHEGIMSNTDI